MKKIKLFAMNSSRNFGEEVSKILGITLTKHEEYYFPDGEPYCASLENVRGKEVFVIQSLYSDEVETVNDKFVQLLNFMGSLRDASAKRITVVAPYMGARQDRKTASRAPVTTKYMARILKSVWAKRIMTLDIHNPAVVQNANHIPVDLLEAKNLFAVECKRLIEDSGAREVVILSPDSGGLGRARSFRNVLSSLIDCHVGIACMDKEHKGSFIKGYNIISTEPIHDKSIILYDDMISSGKTNLECIEACKRSGAREVLASCAAHGLFVGKANEYLDNGFLKNILITDTVEPFRLKNESVLNKLKVIKTTRLFAEAIRRTHRGESISDLIDNIF